jgi:trans-2,3-dihydro-3-hydroxyanthranilate isomerase
MQFYYVDVFTDRPLAGNPLAVFVEDGGLTDPRRQAIAREVGFSETTFVDPRPRADGSWRVRIFTPAFEVPFAGHPTLGTADVIARHLAPGADRLVLALDVGPIPVARVGDQWVMDHNPPTLGPAVTDRARAAALVGLSADDMAPGLPVQKASTGLPCWVLPLKDHQALDRCRVDHRRYEGWLADQGPGNLAAFVEGSPVPGAGMAVRVFVDDPGYYEDPATGSAAGALAGYLVEHRVLGSGSVDVVASQGDQMGRPSRLGLKAWRDGDRIRIQVAGSVVPVAAGRWG